MNNINTYITSTDKMDNSRKEHLPLQLPPPNPHPLHKESHGTETAWGEVSPLHDLSLAPDASTSLCTNTVMTVSVWPRKIFRHWPVSMDQHLQHSRQSSGIHQQISVGMHGCMWHSGTSLSPTFVQARQKRFATETRGGLTGLLVFNTCVVPCECSDGHEDFSGQSSV